MALTSLRYGIFEGHSMSIHSPSRQLEVCQRVRTATRPTGDDALADTEVGQDLLHVGDDIHHPTTGVTGGAAVASARRTEQAKSERLRRGPHPSRGNSRTGRAVVEQDDRSILGSREVGVQESAVRQREGVQGHGTTVER